MNPTPLRSKVIEEPEPLTENLPEKQVTRG